MRPYYDVPNQPGDDEDRGRAPIMAVAVSVVLVVVTAVILVVTR